TKFRKLLAGACATLLLLAALAFIVPKETLMAQSPALAPPQKTALTPAQMNDSMLKLQSELLAKYGEGQKARIRAGLHHVAGRWRSRSLRIVRARKLCR